MKKLLVIGAGFLQSFVIKKAKDMGYEVLTVDPDEYAPGFRYADKHELINIVEKEECLEYAKREKIDGVLTAATDFGVITASYIAEQMGLNGLNYETAKIIKNKYKTKKCFFDNNIDDTDKIYEVNLETNLEELKNKISYPAMVKPCDGSGSRGASRVDAPEQLENACRYAIRGSISRQAMIEPFINGKEYGIESLVINGEIHVLGVMKKLMTKPPYYAELGHAYPSMLSEDVEKKVKDCAKKALEALGVNNGSVNMDALITDDGKVYIIDVGARMGGNMIGPCLITYGTGIDYMAAMIENALGDFKEFKKTEPVAVATRLLAFEEGDIKKLPNVNEFQKKYDIELYHHMKPGQHVNEYHTNLDGLGYVVAKADTTKKAIEKAKKAYDDLSKMLF